MILRIASPTKTYVETSELLEITALKNQLSYTNTSVSYRLNQLRKNKWLRNNNPTRFESQKAELEAKLKNYLYYKDEGGLYMRTGYIPHLRGLKFDVSGRVERPAAKPMAWKNKPDFDPHPFQNETFAAMIAEGHASAELATGLGKSFIMEMLARHFGGSCRVVVVTPGKSIFSEIHDNFTEHFGHGIGAYGDGKKTLGKRVTVCIAKSLTMVKPGTKEWEYFSNADVVISDESHTNPAETNEKVFHGLLADVPWRFFLSATQTRNDGSMPLLNCINGKQVYKKTIAEGIREGYLSPLEFVVKTVQSQSSFYSSDAQKMKRKHYLHNDEILEHAAKTSALLWRAKREQSLILVEEIEQLANLKRLINAQGIECTYVHGNTTPAPELAVLGLVNTKMKVENHRFNSSEVPILIGTRTVSTGTNYYPTHNTFDLQGNSSEIAFFQGPVGRSTRLYEKSRYFTESSVPKPKSRIWLYRVAGVELMENQLEDRLSMARETEQPITEL